MSIFKTWLYSLVSNGAPQNAVRVMRKHAQYVNDNDLLTEAIVLCGEWATTKGQENINAYAARVVKLINTLPDDLVKIYGSFDDGEGMQEINGGLYFGRWLCGYPNGRGTVIKSDGSRISGLWIRGKLKE